MGHNIMGDYIKDEEVFSDTLVACLGLCMGLVVAETEQIATMAAKLIEVQYEVRSLYYLLFFILGLAYRYVS